MSSFESISPQPPLGRTVFFDWFAADPRPEKLLLATGALKDAQGRTPQLECVRIAGGRVHERGLPRDYLPVTGDRTFLRAVERLLLGNERADGAGDRLRSAHTPGGTAALWVAGMFLRTALPRARIWVSDPTWSNHVKVFSQAGLQVERYPYYDAARRALRFDETLAAVAQIPPGDVVFFHAATHNPTGLDPSDAQWRQLRDAIAGRGVIVFFDVAFFGFSRGLREDLRPVEQFYDAGCELLIAASFSKSFSMYNERVGSLSVVGSSGAAAANAFGHVEHLIRGSYSNPPLHGAAIVAEVLNDAELTALWEADLAGFRQRIATSRRQLQRELRARGAAHNLEYLTREGGIFTRLDLPPEAVERLRLEHALYLGAGGSCNVTAVPDASLARFCELVAPLIRPERDRPAALGIDWGAAGGFLPSPN